MKRKFFALFLAIIMLICSACFFTACDSDDSTDDQTQVAEPVDPPEEPVDPPEEPVDPPEEPETPPEEPETPPEEPITPPDDGNEFEGNLPSNPNREDSYEAK